MIFLSKCDFFLRPFNIFLLLLLSLQVPKSLQIFLPLRFYQTGPEGLVVAYQNAKICVVNEIRTCPWAPGSPCRLLEENARPQRDLKATEVHISMISTQHGEKMRSVTNSKSLGVEKDEFTVT